MENATNGCTLVEDMGGNSTDSSLSVSQLLVVPIFLISLVGNTCTIIVIASFKKQRVPDVLVLGLAITDMVATLIPIPMTIYSYLFLKTFPECSALCVTFATIAQFTRYSSALITTVIAFERYLAICRPFFYRSRCTPAVFWLLLVLCWLIAGTLAIPPGPLELLSAYTGYCLFNFTSPYAVAVIVYALVQFVVVLVCFVRVTVELIKVKMRRRRMSFFKRVAKRHTAAKNRDSRPPQSPGLVSRISDLGKSLKTAAPTLSGKLQLGSEAQFLRMFIVVVIFFYLSWLPIVVMIIYAQVVHSQDALVDAIFWGIRLTIVSLAVNPFLYGLLAGQYRKAYLYVLRLMLSRCCSCVNPPRRNVFARESSLVDSSSSSDDAHRRTHPQFHLAAVTNKTAFIPFDTDSLENVTAYTPSISDRDDEKFVVPMISEEVSTVCNGHLRSNSLTNGRTLSPHHIRSKNLSPFSLSGFMTRFNSLQSLAKTNITSNKLENSSSHSQPSLT